MAASFWAPADPHAAGQRSQARSQSLRKRAVSAVAVSNLTSTLRLDDSSGKGWLWSPRVGDVRDERATSADSFRRKGEHRDLFNPCEGQATFLTPRAQKHAFATALAARTATPSGMRTPRDSSRKASARLTSTDSRDRVPTPARGVKFEKDESASPRTPRSRAEELSPLSSVHRAHACSIKGHHYQNRSFYSSGLWRDMPLYTPWGLLESMKQPSLSCATARVARGAQAAPGRELVAPYQEVKEAELSPRTPRPDSARAHYLTAMSVRDPILGKAPGASPEAAGGQSDGAGQSLSPSPRPVSSRLVSEPSRHLAESPWHAEAEAVAKSPRCPTERMMSTKLGMPAGMNKRQGAWAAALDRVALEAADCDLPQESLSVATRLSDDCLHKIEGGCGTPRDFNLHAHRKEFLGSDAGPRKRVTNRAPADKGVPVPPLSERIANRAPADKGEAAGADLAGVRRARARASYPGFNARQRPPRWQF